MVWARNILQLFGGPLVDFLFQFHFDVCCKESMVAIERNVRSRFSINNYIPPFLLDKNGAELRKSVRGHRGSKAFCPRFFICTFSGIRFLEKVLDIIKSLEMQKSIRICRFSLCSSGSS